MNILFVIENYIPHIGGVEVVFKNLAEGLASLGHDVSLVTHRLKGTKKFEIIDGVKVYRVNCFDNRYIFTIASIPKVLYLSKKADIIHTTTFNGAPPAWFASKLRKKPLLITVHEVWLGMWHKLGDMSWFSTKIHEFLEHLIYLLKYDHYASVSNSTMSQLRSIGVKEEKITTVYNGVDYRHFDPKQYDHDKVRKKYHLQKNFVSLTYGRPGVSKGIEYAIMAVPKIKKVIKNYKMLLILSKDPSYKKRYDYLLSLIQELDVKDDIILLEPQPYKELPYFITASDVVIVPSLAEGFGYTAAESCALDVPVVASNTTSLPEVVSGKFVLVNPKDPEAISEGVIKVFNKNCTETKPKRFTIAENIKNYLKIYENLIEKEEADEIIKGYKKEAKTAKISKKKQEKSAEKEKKRFKKELDEIKKVRL